MKVRVVFVRAIHEHIRKFILCHGRYRYLAASDHRERHYLHLAPLLRWFAVPSVANEESRYEIVPSQHQLFHYYSRVIALQVITPLV